MKPKLKNDDSRSYSTALCKLIGIDSQQILCKNVKNGWYTDDKPIYDKLISDMDDDEQQFRIYCLRKREANIEKKYVKHFSLYIDIRDSNKAINEFFEWISNYHNRNFSYTKMRKKYKAGLRPDGLFLI